MALKDTVKEPTAKEVLMQLIAKNYGPSNAAIMEDALSHQKKQIQGAMDQGMSAEDIAKSRGMDLNNIEDVKPQSQSQPQPADTLKQLITSKPASSPFGFGGASQDAQGNIVEQQPGFVGKLLQTLLTGGGAPNLSANLDLMKMQQAADIQKTRQGKEPSLASEIAAMTYQDKKENAKTIADEIESGDQLADFTSLYGLAGPVKAELGKRGVDVATLQKQAIAEKKLAQTLNGPQQVRLRQSINSVTQGLDELESLNSEFGRFGIKAFNKAKIEAFANGAGTPEQQELAQRYKTNINALQEEYGNVIMGGNSPTDKALDLSARTFNQDYNNTSIMGAIKESRRLLKMRLSAIDNVGANSGDVSNKNTSNGSSVNLKSKYGLE